jgi:Spy/CpxP family protein refolding chaperone
VSLLLPASGPASAAAAAAAKAAAAAAAAASAAGPPLFLVDGRCMPGMEGGPIRCRWVPRLWLDQETGTGFKVV